MTVRPTPILSPEESGQLEWLRAHRRAHRQKKAPLIGVAPAQLEPAALSRGQRVADWVAATIGS